MNTKTAAASGEFFQRIDSSIDGARAGGREPDGKPIHRNSRRAGTCEASFWRGTSRQDVQKVLMAARQYERTKRAPGKRNGPLGGIALEVLALFANLVNFKSGRLDPSLDYITDKLRRSRDAVVRALKALRDHGFLDWLRRFEPVPNDGRGPQVRQVSNAYRLSAPKRALALLGRWAGRPAAPDDDQAARAERAAIEAEHVATLDLAEFATFKIEDSRLAKALAQMGKAVSLRESAKRTESKSISCSYAGS
ncbi:helix-turn-helix domain-containing protein [Paracoccus gahaiensis]|uniref:Helix-turn-helix domain-containing protein n=1 Tax=Paracoccus gahaiensis TaxID=1706839 RepID=A0A4U0R6G4_9RHOB|nr:helix-turn-helix domain-containing protein [Paracoccus gahaiensis]TJZ90603.1 helix-turn-helix domain-containing protein [Paracoccus gahaiensis]